VTSQKQKHHNQYHLPVMLDAVIDVLKPKQGESYLDLTAGYGGHATAVIELTQSAQKATLVDRDANAIISLKHLEEMGARLINTDFVSAARALLKAGESFDVLLVDLGVSSPQLDNADRGFSFLKEAPLDMRMDPSQELDAKAVVNNYPVDELTQILKEYGEVKGASRIANAIVRSRPIETTTELADVISQTQPLRGKIHPATRTFQAIRMAVNDELDQIKQLLPMLPDLLKPGGRMAVISFHSLEDRLVKRFLREESRSGYEARLQLINKKPLKGDELDENNPRARSAKLRAAVKIKTKTKKGA
jgi:16S rRNA (cytosine1402-N4)-methyltransferase